MIHSKTGNKFILEVSPIYFQSRVMKSIFNSIGNEVDLLEYQIRDIEKQKHAQTATWGIKYWEEAVGLPVNSNKDLMVRRSLVLTKMQTAYSITEKRIKSIVEAATGLKVNIEQDVSPYTFEVELINGNKLDFNFINILNETKPAHLSYLVKDINTRDIQIRSNNSSVSFRYPLTGILITSTKCHRELSDIGNISTWEYIEVLIWQKANRYTWEHVERSAI